MVERVLRVFQKVNEGFGISWSFGEFSGFKSVTESFMGVSRVTEDL